MTDRYDFTDRGGWTNGRVDCGRQDRQSPPISMNVQVRPWIRLPRREIMHAGCRRWRLGWSSIYQISPPNPGSQNWLAADGARMHACIHGIASAASGLYGNNGNPPLPPSSASSELWEASITCNRTVQFIRAQLQWQLSKQLYFRTWVHINLVVREITRDFKLSPTYSQDRTWFNIHISHVT
jgi:hypothetical protein